MPDTNGSLFDRVRDQVAAVADDPERRYQLCDAFYRKYGFGDGTGFGSSELEFLRWEIERGVLNPLTAPRPGSRWWRAVNAGLLYDAQCAAALIEAGSDTSASGPIRQWVAYIKNPSPRTWYRAHNASTAAGYLKEANAAREECGPECTFMNVVLYRVLYAQALVEGNAPGLLGFFSRFRIGPVLREMERLLADPKSPSVDLLVHVPDFYPRHYPLTSEDILHVQDRGHSLGALSERMLDQVLVSPCLTRLYSLAAGWIGIPQLQSLVVNHEPVYPKLTPRT